MSLPLGAAPNATDTPNAPDTTNAPNAPNATDTPNAPDTTDTSTALRSQRIVIRCSPLAVRRATYVVR
ncbi:MAG: hypothetical protein EXR73_06850 [Myxococcales bacterium]|nr:hypothetical protein [Myxococcales bacterium]